MPSFLSPTPDLKASSREPTFAVRLSWLYITLFVMGGIQLPFFPVWLKAKGLPADLIGFVLAVPMIVRVIAVPFVTHAADHRDSVRTAIVVTCILTVAGTTLIGLSEGPWLILFAVALSSLAATPVMPLTESYALRGLSARGRAYGPVRLWGSMSFMVGTFGAGFAADFISATSLIWLIVGTAATAAVAALMLAPLSAGAPSSPTAAAAAPRKHMLRDPVFIAVIASASFVQASHAMYYAFSVVAWRSAGLDGTTIAVLWGIGVIAEIALFAYSARLPVFFRPSMMLLIGSIAGAIRWGVMAFDPPEIALPALQLLHAFTFAATHLGSLLFVARTAPQGQAARAQGYLSVAIAIATAALMGLSGVLYGAFGVKAYAAMALAAVAGGACACVAHRAGRVAPL